MQGSSVASVGGWEKSEQAEKYHDRDFFSSAHFAGRQEEVRDGSGSRSMQPRYAADQV